MREYSSDVRPCSAAVWSVTLISASTVVIGKLLLRRPRSRKREFSQQTWGRARTNRASRRISIHQSLDNHPSPPNMVVVKHTREAFRTHRLDRKCGVVLPSTRQIST